MRICRLTTIVAFVYGGCVVHVAEAASADEVRETLARDPWTGTHLVVDSVDAWTLRLDARRPAGA